MLNEDIDPPVPFELQPKSGRRVAVIGSGPAGMAAAYYLLIAGHDVTVFERDPAPGGMLRYGIPQYRLPKIEVLEAEYESVTRLGGRIGCNQGLGRDFTLDDLQFQGYDAVCVAIGCYDTNKLGIPNEDADGVIDGLEYLADGDPRPRTRATRQARHRHRRRLHLDGLHPHLDPPGRLRGDPRLPPRHEGHARLERGPRGDRGRRDRHLPGRPGRGSSSTTKARSPASSSSATGSASRTPRAAVGRSRRRGRSSPSPCDRVLLAIGQGPDLSWFGPGTDGPEATKQRRLQADAVTFETGRPGVFGTGDVRIGAATVVAGRRRGPAGAPTPSTPTSRASTWRRSGPARSWPSRSRSSSRSCRSRARSRSPATASRRWRPSVRNKSYVEYEIPYSRPRPWPSRPAACSAPARRSASATCAGWASSTARRCRPSSRASTRAPATGA